ncbi:MAG: LpqB family beta-propeller domain-containing protein [Microbacterium sp.]
MSRASGRGGVRGILTTVAATVALVALTACGSLPTSGPVNAGKPIPDTDSNGSVVFLPDGPSKDATPQQIVEGFIAAGSGPSDNWGTAREFLTPEVKSTWNPRAGVTVYRPGERTLRQVAEGEYTLSVTPAATIDATGELTVSGDSGDISLSFTLAPQQDGQWRITQAPDGIVLDRSRFEAVYASYSLQFFDPTWTYLVPDQRWFPTQYAATSIAEALVDGGPSAWLEGSVSTAFVDGARLAQVAVPVRSNVASVSLQPGARSLGRDVLDRMQTQLQTSLAPVADQVDMLVDEQPLTASAVSVRSTRIDSRPLVRTAEAFGFASGASGSSIEEIPGLSDALLPISALDIEVNADRTEAAVRDTAGAVSMVGSDGAVTRLDTRPALIAPSIDPRGYVWSVPENAPGAVLAFGTDGTKADVKDAWPAAAQITAQRVSRDGTRVAAVVRDGERSVLWVAGILRDRDGAPTGLGAIRVLGVLPGPATALTWIDGSTLAAVTVDQGDQYLYTQEVGGFGATQRTPDAATTVAGGVQSGGLRLRDANGQLYAQQGSTNWQNIAAGIVVLAIQQGSPR